MHAIAIHGGAGTLSAAHLTPDNDRTYRAGLKRALRAGFEVLVIDNGPSDAVRAATESVPGIRYAVEPKRSSYAARNRTPPTDGCTDPVPAKVGRFNVQPYHRWYTTTPLFYGPGPDGYCVKVLGEQREFCPARSDCPGYKCEERQACERVGVGGLPLWRCSGQAPEVQENGYFARCGGDSTWIESCSTDGTVCTRRELTP